MFRQEKPFRVAILLVAIVSFSVIEGARAGEPTEKAAGDDAFETKVLRALAQPVALDYQKTPLCDALPDLSRRLKIPIVLDRAALKVTGIAADTPVTIEIVGLPAEIVFGRMLGYLRIDLDDQQRCNPGDHVRRGRKASADQGLRRDRSGLRPIGKND